MTDTFNLDRRRFMQAMAAAGVILPGTAGSAWAQGKEPLKVGVTLPDEVDARLREAVTRAYHLLGARDYARVDLRVTAAGELFILEVNPNPSITSIMIDSALPALEFSYDQFIGALVRNAAARTPGPAGSRRTRA